VWLGLWYLKWEIGIEVVKARCHQGTIHYDGRRDKEYGRGRS
jgi:hypothetical protein